MTLPDIAVCQVPAGIYMIGSNEIGYSRPAHEVTLTAFAIGRTPVTNAQFLPFVEAGGYADETLWSEAARQWLQEAGETRPAFLDDPAFNGPDQPVVGISWYEAQAYARWLARSSGLPWRVPTEAEWEAAARGPEDAPVPRPRVYNTAERGLGRTTAVTDETNVSWCGARDMVGNVWEWTSTRWGRGLQMRDFLYPYTNEDGRERPDGSHARIVRGGSWFDPLPDANPANRARYLADTRASNIGFRLARE